MPQLTCLTPIGELTLSEEAGSIIALDWGRGRDQVRTPLLEQAVDQLQDYFDGKRQAFSLPLAPVGTSFQRRVWDVLCRIPYGQVTTYGLIATALGGSARAVGQASGANPIPILIPCHRVTAMGGSLGGYSGGEGVVTKRWLLHHEGWKRGGLATPGQEELMFSAPGQLRKETNIP